MTAEIAILNRRGIALAADSALTINNNKVLNSAVKLFTLDSAHYIGIMIYGNADFMDVPWEVILKTFREKIKNNVQDSVEDYVKELFKHIKSLKPWTRTSEINRMVQHYMVDVISGIDSNRDNDTNLYQNTLNLCNSINSDGKFYVNRRDFVKSFSPTLKEYYNKHYGNNDQESANLFVECVYKALSGSTIHSSNQTGLVVAGYGSSEVFPSIIEAKIDGILGENIKYEINGKHSTDPRKNDLISSIRPFAQQEMVLTAVTGINPDLNNYRVEQLNGLISKLSNLDGINEEDRETVRSLVQANNDDFEDYRRKEYTDPVTNMLNSLSISELGDMAETLVSLTSFRRKFSGDMQTVGGPVDVLVISRSDGPVWIKRKKYFTSEMNEGYKLRRR
ncbi:hypothetical protein ACLUV9_09490 [Limosilactobacillus balticus]|uniref:hypothetical protein n=1 Tax=Limosilactobacillus balticus TaxID=2759747 RepID=UPI0039953283